MENPHFQWENPLFLWPCSIAMLNYQRVLRFGEVGLLASRNRCSSEWECTWKQTLKQTLRYSGKLSVILLINCGHGLKLGTILGQLVIHALSSSVERGMSLRPTLAKLCQSMTRLKAGRWPQWVCTVCFWPCGNVQWQCPYHENHQRLRWLPSGKLT